MRIIPGDLDDPRVVALLAHHVLTARAQTGRGSAHALDLDALRDPAIAVWTLWSGDALIGIGALRTLGDRHGEVKSMHVRDTARGQGAGGLILRHIMAEAAARGMTRLSLETGAWDYFHAAHALYRRHGFIPCAPFAPYAPDPNSLFMTRAIGSA